MTTVKLTCNWKTMADPPEIRMTSGDIAIVYRGRLIFGHLHCNGYFYSDCDSEMIPIWQTAQAIKRDGGEYFQDFRPEEVLWIPVGDLVAEVDLQSEVKL